VPDLLLFAAPLGGLVFLFAVGAGPAVALAPQFPPDAQAALAPVVAASLLACASVLLPLDVPARPLAISVATLGVVVGVALRRRVTRALRAAALPVGIAVAALALAGVPGLARGDWHAATLYRSTDSYHWSSQARSYLDGPAPSPVGEHPDRLTYERSRSLHWAVAVPFGLLLLAWLSGSDPPAAYGALAALLGALLPLAAFFVARACLAWRPLAAGAAALALAANAALLFASYFSWQQQVAGTAFAFAAAAALRLALEPEGRVAETALAALLTAAALATYRLGFAPYFLGLLATVVAAYAIRRRRHADLRRVGRALAGFCVVTALVAAPSLAALARGLPDFFSSGGFDTAFKRGFPAGQLGEALGLVPHVWSVEEDWPAALRLGWLALAWAIAAVLLVAGARRLSAAPGARADFVAAGAALTVGGYAVLALPPFAPYLSFKLLSYGAPFLVLLALTPLARGRALLPVAAVALAVPSVGVAAYLATERSETPAAPAGLEAAAGIPLDAVIAVAVDDPWEQAWTLYYLREHTLSIGRPSYLLTAQGPARDPETYRHGPVGFVVRERGRSLSLAPAR
jgi:hypothetical protein